MAESTTEKTENKADSKKINISTKKLVRTMLQGGLAAVLTACGAMSEAKQEIPQVELDKIIENPSLYTELPILSTSGYPEKSGVKTFNMPTLVYTGNGYIPSFVNEKVETYELHTNPNVTSPSMEFTLSTFMPGAPIEPFTPQLDIKDSYDLTGHVMQIQTVDGKTMYFLQVGSYEKAGPTTQPTP